MSASDDRWDITDVLQHYARSIDRFDFAAVASVFADDAVIEYGGYPEFHGGAATARFLDEHTRTTAWHQHLLSVAEIGLDGDEASTLTYFVAHAVGKDDADRVRINVGEYRDRLRRTPDGWKIVERRQQTGWKESRRRSPA
jgi:ketosteroid isomerase-like protein